MRASMSAGAARRLGGDERVAERRLVLGDPRANAEGAGERGQVGARVPHGGSREAALLLLHVDERQRLIVEDHDDDGQAEPRHRLELGGHHHEPAVAGEAHHAPIGMDELGGDGRRQREAHGRQPVGDEAFAQLGASQ